MGRSVSTPAGAQLIAYEHIDSLWFDEDCGEWVADEFAGEFFAEDTAEQARKLWPSFEPFDGWAGREDRILLRNGHAEFGVSEYGGLWSIWIRPRPDVDHEELAEAWVTRIGPTFGRVFGSLVKIGSMSNGEGVYERKTAG